MSAQKSIRFHYAWVIAAISCLMIFTTVGLIQTAYSSVRPYLGDAYGLTQAQNGFLTTVRTVANLISMFFTAIFYKKLTYRWGMTLGMLCAVCGYLTFGLGSSFIHGCIAMCFNGLARTFAGMIGVSALLNAWFSQYRATVIGLASCCSGFTAFIMPPILSRWFETGGFQSGCFNVSILLGVFTVLVALLVRDTPAKMGLTRLGEGADTEEKKTRKPKKVLHHNYIAGRKEHIIMLIVAALSSMCYAHGDFNTVNLTTAGWSNADAAMALSSYGLCLMIGKFLYGFIADHLPMRKASIIYYGAMSIAFVSFMCVRFTWWTMPVAMATFVIYTLGGALPTNGLSTFAIDMSPSPEKFGSTVQQYNIMYNVASAIFCWVAGITADITGYYTVAYLMCLVCAVVGFILVQVAYGSAARNYKRAHAEEPSPAEGR